MRMTRALLGALLLALLAGCTPPPTPLDALRPVSSPSEWAAPTATPGPSPTTLQPELLWHAAVPGIAHRLWWQGETLVVSGLNPATLPWEERYLAAFDPAGQVRWQRDLRPTRLLDAALDDAGNFYMAQGGPREQGNTASLDPSGALRWQTPWADGWPRSLRVSPDGSCTAVGFDGRSGPFPGRLQLLGADGQPVHADMADRLDGFAAFPSHGCERVLLGYEGSDAGLYDTDLYRGIGVRLLDAQGTPLWSVINYHRPLALSSDGSLAIIAGVLGADRAYDPPHGDPEPAPPFGQVLWLNGEGAITGRFRLPLAAAIHTFAMTPDGGAAVLDLTSHRFAGESHPITQQHLTWHDRTGRVRWELAWEGDLADLSLARGGNSLLLAQHLGEQGDWLSLLDADGRLLWRRAYPATIVAASLSPDGQTAAVLAADGLSFFATHVK